MFTINRSIGQSKFLRVETKGTAFHPGKLEGKYSFSTIKVWVRVDPGKLGKDMHN